MWLSYQMKNNNRGEQTKKSFKIQKKKRRVRLLPEICSAFSLKDFFFLSL